MKTQIASSVFYLTTAMLFAFPNYKPSRLPQGPDSIMVTAGDVPSALPDDARKQLIGEWRLTLTKEDDYQIVRNNLLVVSGKFTAVDNRVIFKDNHGSLAFTQPGTELGTCSWTIYEN